MRGILRRMTHLGAVLVLVGGMIVGVNQKQVQAASIIGNVVDLAGDDVITDTPVPIGFNFDFYGTTYTDANVTTNGVFAFTGTSNSTSGQLPSSGDYGAAIVPFWTDLFTENREAKSIYYKTIGTPGSRQFVLQWTNMNLCCDMASPVLTFEIILNEGTNKIQFEYTGLPDDPAIASYVPTIGIQKDGTYADVYTNDWSTPLPIGNSAIEYTPNGSGGYTDTGHLVAYNPIELTIEGLPGMPSLHAPINSTSDVATSDILLTWDAAPGATKYDVVVGTTPLLATNTLGDIQVNGNSWIYGGMLNPSGTYYWRVAAGNDQGFTYSDVHSFTVLSASQNTPNVPTNLAPTALTSGATVDPTKLLTTPLTFDLSDTDLGQQVGYEFVIATSSDPADSVVDYISPLGAQGSRSYLYGSQTGGHFLKGSATTNLVDATSYYLFVRTFDETGAGSDFNTLFTPSFVYTSTPAEDNDNVATSVEANAPNAGDANNDGLPDTWQSNVSSFTDPVTSNYAVLQVDGLNPNDCRNQSASVVSESSQADQDAGYNYPAGLMNFTVTCLSPGATAKITQYFYGSYAGTITARKYNPITKTYAVIPGAIIGTTTVGGQPAVRVEYFVTDGGALDQDGVANGTIVDPSGIAVSGASGTVPNTGIAPIRQYEPLVFTAVGALLLSLAYAYRRKIDEI